MFSINPSAEVIGNEPYYPTLSTLPEPVDAVVIFVPPATEQVVRSAAVAGIRRVWMQQGAESEAAIQFCEENGISVVASECILMFAEPITRR